MILSAHSSRIILFSVALLFALAGNTFPQTRVKDVGFVLGARDNDLVGYGVVVGLAGQGDSDLTLTTQTIVSMVRRFGIQVPQTNIRGKNTAVVMVTARIPAQIQNGGHLDVTVSSMSDAKSIYGGTLLQTPLVGADNKVYAVAQGPIALGGFFAGVGGPGGSTVQKNHPTVGRIPNGALVEREIPTELFRDGVLKITLNQPDFTSVVRMAHAINQALGPIAFAESSSTVKVYVPEAAQEEKDRMEFIARIENVEFTPDAPARVVINEKTGTIVMSAKVRIQSVAVAHGNLTVNITDRLNVSQPNSFTGSIGNVRAGAGGAGGGAAPTVIGSPDTQLMIGGRYVYEDDAHNQVQVASGVQPPTGYKPVYTMSLPSAPVTAPGGAGGAGGVANVVNGTGTAVTSEVTTTVTEPKVPLVVFDELPTLEEVASALNALGVTPRDMMTIFQAMKQSGALQAELELQ